MKPVAITSSYLSRGAIFAREGVGPKRSVADDTSEELKEYAGITAKMQNSGRMDSFIASAVKLAESMSIKVCDCYIKWKELSKSQDVTMLLANRINHPVKEMHELFAQSIFDVIMT